MGKGSTLENVVGLLAASVIVIIGVGGAILGLLYGFLLPLGFWE